MNDDVGKEKSLREDLAEVAHDVWSDWMNHLLGKATAPEDGVVLPVELVERWERQMGTPYAKLSWEERESDRKVADRYLETLRYHVPQVTEVDLVMRELADDMRLRRLAAETILGLRDLLAWSRDWHDGDLLGEISSLVKSATPAGSPLIPSGGACQACDGTGRFEVFEAPKACQSCDGTGRQS